MYVLFIAFMLFIGGLDLAIKVRHKKSSGKSSYDSRTIVAAASDRRV